VIARKPSHLIALLLTLALWTSSFATTVIPMSVERLTHASSNVIVAQAESSWTQWDAQHKLIFTYTKFHVSQNLKGQAAQEVVMKQMGGRSGAYEQKVAGVRHWKDGEEAVLFAHPSLAADSTLVVTGLMQGNFRVVPASAGQERTVTNGAMGVDTFNAQQGTIEHFAGSRMPLSRLESLVHDAVAHEVTK
jgi:hypothetical protein